MHNNANPNKANGPGDSANCPGAEPRLHLTTRQHPPGATRLAADIERSKHKGPRHIPVLGLLLA